MKFSSILLSMLMISACSYYNALFHSEENKDIPLAYTKEEPLNVTKAYEIAATRITNKMLDDSADIYEKNPKTKLYIKKIVKTSETLPDGFYSAQKSIKNIINGSDTYIVVDKLEDADFVLDSRVKELDSDIQTIIMFNMDIKDKEDNSVKAWSVIIRQMPEDKSWW